MNLLENLKNARIMAGLGLQSKSNAPAQHSGRKKEYYAPETDRYRQEYAKYASDVYQARVQGLNPDNFMEWSWREIRMADIVNPSASIQKQMDNVKSVLFVDGDLSYIPRGAKIEAAGSTWLVTNPANISSVGASCVAERCRTAWNFLDFYGNVRSEPLVVDDDRMRSTAQDPQEVSLVTKGYFNVKCQYNDFTRQLDTNSRLILGSGAYHVTGYADFIQEFTGDYDSVHVLEFTVRYEEPIPKIDDMENHVAGGKNFQWELLISADQSMRVGSEQSIVVNSKRNGETVFPSELHPIHYLYESLDRGILEVSESGIVTALAQGDGRIKVSLEQNPTIYKILAIAVESGSESGVEFTSDVPAEIHAYESVMLQAAHYIGGEETEETVMWELSGAQENAWSYSAAGNTITINCWGGSVKPLTVKAIYGEHEAVAEIKLRGM